MPGASFQRVTYTVANGANTASPEIHLPLGGRLLWVTAGGSAGDGPLRISIDLFPSALRGGSITIVSGWNRSPTEQSGGFSVRKWVDLQLGDEEPVLRCFARNDTGVAVTVNMQVLAEDV